MSLHQIIEASYAISELEGLSGSAVKFELRRYDSFELRRAVEYALNPYKVYGIAQLPASGIGSGLKASGVPPATTVDAFYGLLDKLASREVTGNKAKAHLAQALTDMEDVGVADLAKRIVLKDLRCGVQVTTANRAFPGLIPVFSVQLAKPLEEKHIRFPCLVETKHDGKRIIAVAKLLASDFGRSVEVTLLSRNGLEETGNYHHVKEQLADFTLSVGRSLVFDGELMFGMFGDRKAKAEEAEYIVFDLLEWQEWVNRKCDRRLVTRQTELLSLIEDFGTPEFAIGPQVSASAGDDARSMDDILLLYREVINNGGEGVMVKDPEATYSFKRDRAWMKLKPEESLDLRVIDYFEGEGKYSRMLGGVVVDVSGVPVRVGSGFGDWERKHWWERRDWLNGKVVEVLYTEKTPDGSLRFPRFKRFRDDKEADRG